MRFFLGFLQIILVSVLATELSWRLTNPGQHRYLQQQWPVLAGFNPESPTLLLQLLMPAAELVPSTQNPGGVAVVTPVPTTPGSDDEMPPEALRAAYCSFPKEEASVRSQSSSVYRWTDDQGRVHFGDKPADNSEDLSKQYRNPVPFEVVVEFPGWQGSALIRQRLDAEARMMYRIIAGLLPTRQQRQILLTINLYENEAAFQEAGREFGVDRNTGAFYRPEEHRMYVPVVTRYGPQHSVEVTAALTRHEMTHAITTAMLGTLPVWLSEGLAEYMERLSWEMSLARVWPDEKGFAAITPKSVDLRTLTSMDLPTFYTSNKAGNYRTSAALVHYLLGFDGGKQWLAQVLKRYADQPCHDFDPVLEFAQGYPGGLTRANADFVAWLEAEDYPVHRY